eukprot:scaffold7879_cov103-Isochrysis_galbana.AAC.3
MAQNLETPTPRFPPHSRFPLIAQQEAAPRTPHWQSGPSRRYLAVSARAGAEAAAVAGPTAHAAGIGGGRA